MITRLAPAQPKVNLKYNDTIKNEMLKWGKKSVLLERG